MRAGERELEDSNAPPPTLRMSLPGFDAKTMEEWLHALPRFDVSGASVPNDFSTDTAYLTSLGLFAAAVAVWLVPMDLVYIFAQCCNCCNCFCCKPSTQASEKPSKGGRDVEDALMSELEYGNRSPKKSCCRRCCASGVGVIVRLVLLGLTVAVLFYGLYANIEVTAAAVGSANAIGEVIPLLKDASVAATRVGTEATAVVAAVVEWDAACSAFACAAPVITAVEALDTAFQPAGPLVTATDAVATLIGQPVELAEEAPAQLKLYDGFRSAATFILLGALGFVSFVAVASLLGCCPQCLSGLLLTPLGIAATSLGFVVAGVNLALAVGVADWCVAGTAGSVALLPAEAQGPLGWMLECDGVQANPFAADLADSITAVATIVTETAAITQYTDGLDPGDPLQAAVIAAGATISATVVDVQTAVVGLNTELSTCDNYGDAWDDLTASLCSNGLLGTWGSALSMTVGSFLVAISMWLAACRGRQRSAAKKMASYDGSSSAGGAAAYNGI